METQPFVYLDEGEHEPTFDFSPVQRPDSKSETVSGSPLSQRDTFSGSVSYDIHHHESEKEDVDTLNSQTLQKSMSEKEEMTLPDDDDSTAKSEKPKGTAGLAYDLLLEFMADQDKIIYNFFQGFQVHLESLAQVRQGLRNEQSIMEKKVEKFDHTISKINGMFEPDDSILGYTTDGD